MVLHTHDINIRFCMAYQPSDSVKISLKIHILWKRSPGTSNSFFFFLTFIRVPTGLLFPDMFMSHLVDGLSFYLPEKTEVIGHNVSYSTY